jgi:hypothetical protein
MWQPGVLCKLYRELRVSIGAASIVPDVPSYQNILVYPNPTSEKIYFDNNLTANRISIYSIHGSLMLSDVMKHELDISMLPGGVYFLEIVDNKVGKTFRSKFIKL